MKIRLAGLGTVIMLIALLSCNKLDDDSLCDCYETRIRNEISEIVDTIFKGCREVNAGKVTRFSYGSPDFTYVFGGRTYDYQEFYDALSDIYDKMLGQVVTIVDEDIDILDKSTVVYSNNCTFLQNYKDQSTILIDPVVMLFIFRKIDEKWTWIYGVESYGN